EKPIIHEVSLGDTVRFREGFMLVKGVNRDARVENINLAGNDIAVGMQLEIHSNDKQYTAEPIFLLKGGSKFDFGKNVEGAGLKVRFTDIHPEKDKLELQVYQKPKVDNEWIVMKAIQFPYINLFWGGTIVMIVGFLLSIFRRNKELKTS
ncbi:MAG TPA: cytochrome C biogenesis protein, partial [Sphingobacteriaceae bacterium]